MLNRITQGPVIGLDVDGRKFAYAVLKNGEVVEKGITDPYGIIRLVKRHKPSAIAIDNISEILTYCPKLIKKLGRLSFSTYLVQVTRVEQGTDVKLEELVRRYFGVEASKLSPIETAEYLARLCLMGIGSIVRLYESEVRIIIKALVSTSSGGMSRNRYERNIAHRIKSIAKEIAEALRKNNIDYDVFALKDSEGIRSVMFIAYADKEVIRSIVKRRKSLDVKVIVESIPTNSIKFVSLTENKAEPLPLNNRKLIVGVDPGIVTGIAILDLNGNVLALHSAKNFGRRSALEFIYTYGVPVLIAVDTSKPPEYAKKLAAMANAVLYTPERDLTISEKSEIALKLTREQGISIKDPHVRDALAAAYKAYIVLKPKFERIEEEFRREYNRLLEDAKALVIRGSPVKQAVENALRKAELSKAQVREVTIVRHECKCECEDIVREYERTINTLQKEVERLNRLYEDAKRKFEEYVEKITTEARKDQLVRNLQARIEILEYDIERLKAKNRILEGLIDELVKGIKKYLAGSTYLIIRIDDIDELNSLKGMKNVIPMLRLGTAIRLGVDSLLGMGFNTIIVTEVRDKNSLRAFWKNGIKAIPAEDLGLKDDLNVQFVEKDLLDNHVCKLEREFVREVDEEFLKTLIEQYRRSRMGVFA